MEAREIKFRAWDKKTGTMLTMPLDTNFGISRFFGFLPDDAVLIQFTGLKDKHGKDIYEGDIIRWTHRTDKKKTFVKVIEWSLEKTAWILSSHPANYIHLFCPETNIEVIGSIHTHPELLKG